MAKLQGVNISGTIVPSTDADDFATHDDFYGKGGYRIVATIADRDAITDKRRKAGMLVYVEANQTTYRLAGTVGTWSWVADDAAGDKQDGLGGTGEGGKAVIATETAGVVEYRTIVNETITNDSNSLVTENAVFDYVNTTIAQAISGGGTPLGQFTYFGTTAQVEAITATTGETAIAIDGATPPSIATIAGTNAKKSGTYNGTSWTWTAIDGLQSGRYAIINNLLCDQLGTTSVLPYKSGQVTFIDNDTSNAATVTDWYWMVVEDRKSQPDEVTITQNVQGQLQIKDGGVSTAKLADDAVTTDKLATGSVTNNEIAGTAAIDQSKLANLAVATDGSTTMSLAADANISASNQAFLNDIYKKFAAIPDSPILIWESAFIAGTNTPTIQFVHNKNKTTWISVTVWKQDEVGTYNILADIQLLDVNTVVLTAATNINSNEKYKIFIVFPN